MEPAKSEIKFPQVWAPGHLTLKEMGFPFQREQDCKGFGEMLTTGAGNRMAWLSTGGHMADGSFTCLYLHTIIRQILLIPLYSL